MTLAVFGDAGSIPALENVVEQDPFTVNRKGETIYLNRLEARKAIEHINVKSAE